MGYKTRAINAIGFLITALLAFNSGDAAAGQVPRLANEADLGDWQSPAPNRPSYDKVYHLEQTTLPDGTIFFFDATTFSKLRFIGVDKREADGIYDNGWRRPTNCISQSNAGVIVSGNDVSNTVDSWVDDRGFLHSVSTLKRQLVFNRWLRDSGSSLPPLPVSGIMDRATLWATSSQLHRRLSDALASRHLQSLRNRLDDIRDGKDAPALENSESAASNALVAGAVDALRKYDSALNSLRFRVPTPLPTPCSPYAYHDGCLDLRRDQRLFADPMGRQLGCQDGVDFAPSESEPQDSVAEEVAGESFTLTMAATLAKLESAARISVVTALEQLDDSTSDEALPAPDGGAKR